MLALIAAVLFVVALIFKLAGLAFGPFDREFLVVAGFVCLALYMAGLGARSWRR